MKKQKRPEDVRGTEKRPEFELVFGIAGPVGADLDVVSDNLAEALRSADYDVYVVRLSDWIKELSTRLDLRDQNGELIKLVSEPEEERIRSYMDAGNAIRRMTSSGAAVAHAAVAAINQRRTDMNDGKPCRTAYILRSLKHEDEVFLLRSVYGPAFFLLGINVSRERRVSMLADRISKAHGDGRKSRKRPERVKAAELLVDRDEREIGDPYGQRLREVFQLADVFIRLDGPDTDAEVALVGKLERFVNLILSNPFSTPNNDERLMYLAYASSLSSGALGRQVGAVVASSSGEVLGVGWNDVPKPGGGLYQEGETPDERDIGRKRDSSQQHSEELVDEVLRHLKSQGVAIPDDVRGLSNLPIMSLLEFGRTTHAEMEAIVAAGRVGTPTRGATLYSTTFPCHECARLIVTAGIQRVVYVEPYPKSKALALHADAMILEAGSTRQKPAIVRLESFDGIGPRRYAELFSIMPTLGNQLIRKDKRGFRVPWEARKSKPRTQLIPLSYLEMETKSIGEIKQILDAKPA